MYFFDAPSDFSTPISRVRSMIVVYIERKITRNPIATAMLIMMLMNGPRPGTVDDVISDKIILQRPHFVAGQQRLDFIRRRGRLVGTVALDEKHGRLVARAGHFLQGGHQNE